MNLDGGVMKKYILGVIITVLFIKVDVYASGSDDYFKVVDEASFLECLSKPNACELSSDITLSSRQAISNNVILDLKGHSIMPDDNLALNAGLLVVERGARLTIIDTLGSGKISTGDSGKVWGAIELVGESENVLPAELIINSGTIEGYYYGIVGNGKRHNSKVTINGGVIKTINLDSVGIYQPQMGKMEINGGTISGGTGIEIRSGDLIINGGTIKGLDNNFGKTANKNGTTTTGVGLSIAQHTTKNDVNVTINNGNFSGIYALYEWNPHHNFPYNVVVKINNGDFKTNGYGGEAVYSENFTKFINGGKFNSDVSKYLKDYSSATIDVIEENVTPEIRKDSFNYRIFFIFLIPFLLFGFWYLNKKKNYFRFFKAK